MAHIILEGHQGTHGLHHSSGVCLWRLPPKIYNIGALFTQQQVLISPPASEETAYPLRLAAAISRAFAAALIAKGWVPLPESLSVNLESMNLQEIRAMADTQPKASRLPPLVHEHKCVYIVPGPLESLATAPVFPMQRLKQPWRVPADCSGPVSSIPGQSQLLRFTPLRSNGGVNQ